jgi:hypothetical protein
MSRSENLARKIEGLSQEQVAEVEEFVEFLRFRAQDRSTVGSVAAASEPAFEKVWSNPDDDAYDAL